MQIQSLIAYINDNKLVGIIMFIDFEKVTIPYIGNFLLNLWDILILETHLSNG